MNELEWLNEQRPEVKDDEPGRVRARRELREHIRPRPDRRAAWRPRLAFASVAALVVTGVAIAWPTGGPAPAPAPTVLAPEAPAPELDVAPLVLLSERIAQEPEPQGDATLVIRSQQYPDDKAILGHDLYLDDGRYYYGATREELKAAAVNSRYHEPLVKAAIAAPALPPEKARRAMDVAVGGGNAPKVSRSIEDNHVWVGSMDALLAGAGRKDVRAGVMTLLHTIDTVKVTEEGELLKLTATDYQGGYTENLFVDAETGVPQKFEGGVPGKTPDVVVDYDVKRVTAANWADAAGEDAAGQAPAADADPSRERAAPAPPAKAPKP
ncbi:hypothetical protein DVA67_010190 [Solirubrobacter sp. CPCC 204708]|uniref:CU044_5270 family protein n=1 Tax=Solirubrobacter deserti TaxID=2282478 RepID=A0ABT4RU57_9ACTN|nr:hypothetical protein [Solirubrobacter deserti]MBE2316346.1 hypothetical protein [Solirubrobacter deserti]MDA0142122.1 hypothetical protein [Solirubrobacter deserti]